MHCRNVVRSTGLVLLVGVLTNCAPAPVPANFVEDLQEQLINAQPGAVIAIPAGRYEVDRSLSLTNSGVTIRGAGMDKTVLSFKGQVQGAEGLLVQNAKDITIEHLAIEDAKGDALKVNQVENLTIRYVRTEWTGGPLSTNGAYGIYPVQCQNVLIENSVAIGASDAGIYVGQSTNIIVRHSRAEFNVAGIEIENSRFADVYENVATNNTGGILVFDLPDLPVQGGRNTRVYHNQLVGNNTDNFAPPGNIVGTVPAGSGLMINSNDNIEVFENVFSDNQSAHISVVSYLITGRPLTDPNYDPYPESIFIHDNSFSGGGNAPDHAALAQISAATEAPVPEIVWDGITRPGSSADESGAVAPSVLCIQEAAAIRFVNLDAANNFAEPSFERAPHDCTLERLEAVSL